METMMELLQKGNLLQRETAKKELFACNSLSAQYGLSLSDDAIEELLEAREESLKRAGRVEFGGGILPKLIYAFCDSPYVEQEHYEELLVELQDAFYYFKNESLDLYTDDELIDFMSAVFNGRAQGSVEYLLSTSVEALCRFARTGFDEHDADEAGDLF